MVQTVEKNLYFNTLDEIKSQIAKSQTRTFFSVNYQMILLYWKVGEIIDKRQQNEGWGSKIIPQLSKDITNDFPALKGFSERNIKRMLRFYREYKNTPKAQNEIVPQTVAQIDELIFFIPWSHNIVLIEKIKDKQKRLFYMKKILEEGYSRNVLIHQIESGLFERSANATHNFAHTLPKPESDLAHEMLKDPYLFDFLSLEEPYRERELELGLIEHLEKFLLELGVGFSFVGRQYKLEVGENEYYLDLLFYHFKLRCFVVIELKAGEFIPEYAGKLNFYCNVVNKVLKHPEDKPTIGLILCKNKDKLLAEYSLEGIERPIGISQYQLSKALPNELKSSLPTVEEIESELEGIG